MLARKLCWLAAEGCLAVLWVRFSSAPALALGAALLLIPLVSVPLNLYLRKKLRVKLSAPYNLRKGEEAAVVVTLENPTWLPASCGCTLEFQNLLNGITSREKLELSGQPQQIQVKSAFCGRLRVTVEKVRLYDCFGLIGISLNRKEKCHITVQPDCFESGISLCEELGGSAESEQYSQYRAGSDLTETFQLREYVPGDSPRQIHWKLSGKLDRLIVREPGLPIRQDVLLFWERTEDPRTPGATDAQAESVVSIGRGLLEQDVQFRLGWNDVRENRCILHEIRELDDLIALLPRLLSASAGPECHTGAALLMQTRPDALCSHMIYVAGTPAPEVLDWQRHGRLTILTPEEQDYAAQLAWLVV